MSVVEKTKDWLDGFEFTDRIRDLELITNPFSPPTYQLISAPMGYGKTRLLEIAQIRLKEQNWCCINLTLSRKHEYSIKQLTIELLKEFKFTDDEIEGFKTDLDIIHNCGRRLGITIVNFFKSLRTKKPNIKEKICILIDQAEMLDSPYQKESHSLPPPLRPRRSESCAQPQTGPLPEKRQASRQEAQV